MEQALKAGDRVGAFEAVERLGSGGMGEVYCARDTRPWRTVALKVLKAGASPELLHRLERAARAASALNHPNIVQIYDVGEAPRSPAPISAEIVSPSPPDGGLPCADERRRAHVSRRVRALIAQRGGKDTKPLLEEVSRIVKRTEQMVARMADLEEQSSDAERAGLATAIAGPHERLGHAEAAADRRLFERQLEVLLGREEAIGKAVRVLERLRVRRDLAEHQLKRLRLDLSRGDARDVALPEPSSRLESIRDEIDAREAVDEIGAGSK